MSILFMGLLVLPTAWAAAADFLDPEAAFRLSARALDERHLELHFDVAPGYHLYRDKFQVGPTPPGALQVPQGQVEFDPTFGKQVEVFKSPVSLKLALDPSLKMPFKLVVGHQGCADDGLCYAPAEHAFRVDAQGGSLVVSALSEAQAEAWAAPSATPSAPASASFSDEGNRFASALQSGNLLQVAGAFLLAGLLLSFTPCVLPMLPILSSIIVGQKGQTSRAKGFTLALAYALGMALIYTTLGMAAGLAGEGLAAALQNAWVLGGFALLLAALSLSMFGVYELQMPSSVQGRLTEFSGKLQGGQHLGVFIMGGLSALIVGPCVAAPLAGALVYISHTRDVVLGGVALFALACGMSVPLLLVGISAGSFLPRAGAWMERVKHLFGALLLAVALWMVAPVLPSWALMLGVSIWLLATAVYLGAFDRVQEAITPARALTKGLGLLLALAASLQLVGLASGGRDLLQPLQRLASATNTPNALGFTAPLGTGPGVDTVRFQTVGSLQALDEAVRASAKPVMVDFYADWCVACKELETLTFSDKEVRARLAGMTLLRVDVTENNAKDKALMRQHQLFGPPALLFFQARGAEVTQARLIGFQNAGVLSQHLDRLSHLSRVD